LDEYALTPYFGDLIPAFRAGNLAEFRRALDVHATWFQQRSLYLLLREKTMLLLIRNLFKNSIRLLGQIGEEMAATTGINTNGPEGLPSRVSFTQLQIALEVAGCPNMQAGYLVVPLIEQGLFRGYVHVQNETVVLAKEAPMVPVSNAWWNVQR
jgi:hypothetical protein